MSIVSSVSYVSIVSNLVCMCSVSNMSIMSDLVCMCSVSNTSIMSNMVCMCSVSSMCNLCSTGIRSDLSSANSVSFLGSVSSMSSMSFVSNMRVMNNVSSVSGMSFLSSMSGMGLVSNVSSMSLQGSASSMNFMGGMGSLGIVGCVSSSCLSLMSDVYLSLCPGPGVSLYLTCRLRVMSDVRPPGRLRPSSRLRVDPVRRSQPGPGAALGQAQLGLQLLLVQPQVSLVLVQSWHLRVVPSVDGRCRCGPRPGRGHSLLLSSLRQGLPGPERVDPGLPVVLLAEGGESRHFWLHRSGGLLRSRPHLLPLPELEGAAAQQRSGVSRTCKKKARKQKMLLHFMYRMYPNKK